MIRDPKIDDYILAHTTATDDVLSDLAAETHEATGRAASMQISPDQGTVLTILARGIGAVRAVEVGTFTGYSSICIARGLAPEGHLLACDVSEEWTAIARKYWARAGLTHKIELHIAPAAETLRALPLEATIDFAFIDADKTGYSTYYEELVPRVRPGGLICVDNVLWHGSVIDPSATDPDSLAIKEFNDQVVADPRVVSTIVPIRDGMALIHKL